MQKKRKVKIFVILTILLASLFFLNSEKDETITYGLVSITEQKTTPEVLEQLETSTEETMELLIKTTNNNKVKNTIISKGGKIKRITKNYISIEIPANIINEIIEVPELEKIYPNRKYSMLDSISQINANFVNNLGFQGNGIKIAVLDTGIDSHDALKDKIANEKAFTGESHINDINGHGTHVAGIITSIAPEASLLNAKVLDDSGNGYTDTIIAGIEWAIENNANIISMSFGAPYSTPDLVIENAIDDAVNAGISVVVSSGNCGKNCPSLGCGDFRGVTTPGNSLNVITVGAVDKNNNIACFSSGEEFLGEIKPDIVAPGVDISSTTINNGYETKSGTSMAAPHISGAIALILEKAPNLNPKEIKEILENNALDLGTEGKDSNYGSGLVNLKKIFENLDIPEVTEIIEETEGIRYNFTSPPRIIEVNYEKKLNVYEPLIFKLNIENPLTTKILISNPNEEIFELDSLIFTNTNLIGKYDFEITTLNPYGEDKYVGEFIVKEKIEIPENSKIITEDITNFKFLEIKENKAIYEKDNNLYEIEETIFNDPTSLRIFLYENYPLKELELITTYNNQNLIKYDNSYSWFNENYIYNYKKIGEETLPNEILDTYLKIVPSKVGENKTQTAQILKNQETSPEITTVTKESNLSIAEVIDISKINNRIQEITITNETGTYTILASCSDYSNTLGSCSTEGNWGVSSSYPYKMYKCNDMIFIGQLLCWELESQEGDSDYCSVLYDHTASYACSHNQGDCDSDSECYSGYICKDGGNFGLNNDGCCYSDETYDGSWCQATCSAGYLDEYRCSSDMRQRKYQNSDCTTEWKNYKDCNDYDDSGSWGSYYCSGTQEDIKQDKVSYNGYCSTTYNDCRTSSSTETQTVSWNGQGDYCDKALGICTCTEGDSDCDVLGGDECASGLYCDVDWLGTTDYCCPIGKIWDGSQCIADCDSQDYSECYNGDRWWYNSCSNRETEREDCGGRGCSADTCLECSNDYHCGTYEKCVDSTCVGKTCNDYGAISSCTLIGNTYCHPSEPDGNPAQCLDFGNVNCYDYIDTCTIDEYCKDPIIGGAQCFSYECEISSSYWDRTEAIEGTEVHLIVEGSHCDGKTATFEIWESDCPGFDFESMELSNSTLEEQELALLINPDGNFTEQNIKDICIGSHLINTLTDTTFSSNKFEANWEAVYEDDIIGNPDYYFNVIIDNNEEDSSSNFLRVSELCIDNDEDGYGNPSSTGCTYDELDCNDNDKEVNPGRTEVCDHKDNDCDGNIDENNICSADVCNDNNYESADEGCNQEQEMECRDIYHKSTAYEYSGLNSEKTDSCIDYNTVNEAYIYCGDNWDFDDTIYEEINCPSGYVCSDGACIVETCEYSCVDSCIPDTNREGGCFLGDIEPGTCRLGLTCCNKALTSCPIICGDGVCDSKEVCEIDCYSNIAINRILNINPIVAKENEIVTFMVEVENKGVIPGARFIEAAIAPESWAGEVYPDTYRFETVKDNPFPICAANTYYDSKIVELQPGETNFATFSIRAPNRNSIDECDDTLPIRSAWDTEFRIIAGTYEHVSGGEGYEKFLSQTYTVNEVIEDCNFPYGTSPTCSCQLLGCTEGFECNINVGYGTCIEIPTCDIPDGSSSSCDCDSNNDCPSGYICEISSGYDACIEYIEPDECSEIDTYRCVNNDVYRCEQTGARKTLILYDLCTINEDCPSNVATERQCASNLEYDLILEKASSGTIVNKQNGDSLFVNVKVSNDASLNLGYDSNAFNLINGNCLTSNFNTGDNICEFNVIGNPNRYSFTLGDDSGVVEIIDSPYVLYVTNAEQLYKRFDDKKGVDVLLAKTYEKASLKKGIVYDLSLELTESHPFSYAFNLYNQKLNPFGVFDNLYTLTAAKFVRDKCDTCKETIIVGDDYVVPHFRADINLRGGIDFAWNFFGEDKKETYYTDMQLAQRTPDLNLADLQDVFNERNGEEYVSRTTVMIVPPELNEDMRLAVDRFKITLIEKFGNEIEEITGENIVCDTFAYFTDVKSPLIIIGNEQNNDALKCFPYDFSENSMYITRNVWDNVEHAFVLNTLDPEILSFYSMFIAFEEYKNIEAPGMSVVEKIGLGVGTIAIVVGVASTATGIGATWGVPLMYLGYTIDATIIADECYFDNKGGHNWGNCGISVGALVIGEVGGELVGSLMKSYGSTTTKLVSKNINKVSKNIDPKALGSFFKNTDNLGAKAKALSDGIEVFTRTSDEVLILGMEHLSKNMDDVSKLRFLENLGTVSINNGDNLADDFVDVFRAKDVDLWLESIAKDANKIDDIFEVRGAATVKRKGYDILEANPTFKSASSSFNGEFDSIAFRNGKNAIIESKSLKSGNVINPSIWINDQVVGKANTLKKAWDLDDLIDIKTNVPITYKNTNELIFTIPKEALDDVFGLETFGQIIKRQINTINNAGTYPFKLKLIEVIE